MSKKQGASFSNYLLSLGASSRRALRVGIPSTTSVSVAGSIQTQAMASRVASGCLPSASVSLTPASRPGVARQVLGGGGLVPYSPLQKSPMVFHWYSVVFHW